MINTTLETLITQIHASRHKLVLEFAGAGSLGLAWLHAVAGSSRTLVEATDRYSPMSMAALLRGEPERFVSRETAEAMAEQAYWRTMALTDGETECLGVGCTATIATDRVKKGEHGCWIAVRDRHGVGAYGLVIAKGARDRLGEEILVSSLLIHAIAVACEAGELPLELLPDEQVDREARAVSDPLADLLAGTVDWVTIDLHGTMHPNQPIQGGMLSGSYNPLHVGHEQLIQAASVVLKMPVVCEIPIVNADKPPLGYAELVRRVAQFQGRYTLVLSRAPRFVDKARLYPGCTFVLGYDTAIRVLDPRFYEGLDGMREALGYIRDRGCRFLVAGRVQDGVFKTIADLVVPEAFKGLFLELPEQMFRSDLSSTAIRAQQGL
jgi:hypothetical protein